MQYADDTFALYGDLFKEAHAALVKEGRIGRIRQWLGRLANPETEHMVQGLGERVGQQDDVIKKMVETAEKAQFDDALRARQMEQMAKEIETLGARPGALGEAQAGQAAAEQATQQARGGRNLALGAGALGVGAGVPLAYGAGTQRGEADKVRTRNLAFGAGAAAGIAAPTLIKGLGGIARGAAQTGAFPELSGAGYGY